MPKLSSADLTKVLEAVTHLNSAIGPATLRERTLTCVEELIPNELTAFDGWDDEGDYNGSLWYSPPGTVPAERIELFAEWADELPTFDVVINTPKDDIFRWSDFVTLSDFHKTSLFNEFYRHFGGETQVLSAKRLAPELLITCSLHRQKIDFNDRECEVLRLITPHLKAAFINARFLNRIDAERRYLDRAVAKGVVAMDEAGAVIFTSQLAEQWLKKYFGETWGGAMPAAVRDYVEAYRTTSTGSDYFRPAEPLIVSGSTEELKITVTFDTREREMLVFLEERRPHTVGDFECAGVTRREAEILYWIGRGKTDPEIARLLSISPRTVQKHIEHIFTKMGVETRTAAVMTALEAAGR